MKKLKKILILMACAVMVMISCVSLTACSKEQVAENTETVIETGATIIPVELSKETAQGLYTSALQNWLVTDAYEIIFTGQQGSNGNMKTVEIGKTDNKGRRFIYIAYDDEAGHIIGYYNDKSCTLNLEDKTYVEGTSSSGEVLIGAMGDTFGRLYNHITSGRYYNGYYYIAAEQTRTYTPVGGSEVTEIDTIEIMIKDGKFVKGNFATYKNEAVIQFGAYEFKYTNVDTSKIVTSLDGFTKAK